MRKHEQNLLTAYRPKTLRQVRGQPAVIGALRAFARDPAPCVFLFAGPTGVGKTATAAALAHDLGCRPDHGELGGFYEIASGKQDGKAVEKLLGDMRLCPLYGSGWRVAVVNEADYMTEQAAGIWLDGLEHLPPRSVVIFTTNKPGRLSDRFTSRAEVYHFDGQSARFQRALVALVKRIWKHETGRALKTVPADLGRFDWASGNLSIRLALQQIAPYIRSRQKLPESFDAPECRDEIDGVSANGSAAARKAWETRRKNLVTTNGNGDAL